MRPVDRPPLTSRLSQAGLLGAFPGFVAIRTQRSALCPRPSFRLCEVVRLNSTQ